MPDQIDYATLTQMLLAAVDRIRREQETLSTLDAATGDGDHGAAMSKVATAIVQTIDAQQEPNIKALLEAIGWAAMGTDAGSTGPLYGSLFIGMSQGADATGPLDAARFATVLEAGLANLRLNTKAQPGDKTMIDALLPAVEALRAAADAGKPPADCLAQAADAATGGAEATRSMRAAFGRAKNLGERSVGHQDPGACSMALVFQGLKQGFQHA
jgi:dihydroxyacetone kinase-like protein